MFFFLFCFFFFCLTFFSFLFIFCYNNISLELSAEEDTIHTCSLVLVILYIPVICGLLLANVKHQFRTRDIGTGNNKGRLILILLTVSKFKRRSEHRVMEAL